MTNSGGFTILDFTVPTRDLPIIHPCVEAPLCDDCRGQDSCFFDPTCSGCQDILSNPKTNISELFAIMRQWVPQTQRYLALLTREVLRRGAHINDKDGLTDLSLIHYACKAGALGVSNGGSTANLVSSLIAKGADTNLKCHWTDMNALHYSVFFDCDEVVDQLCEHNPALVNSVCSQLDGGNSLHIAGSNLCLKSAKILLKHNGDGGWKDELNRLPYECVPETVSKKEEAVANELRELLREAANNRPPIKPRPTLSDSSSATSSVGKKTIPKVAITKVLTNGDIPDGKPHGLKSESTPKSRVSTTPRQTSQTGSKSLKSTSPILPQSPIVQSPSSNSTMFSPSSVSPIEITLETLGIKVGDKILIDAGTSKSKRGTLRFYGETMFASGHWAGIELEEETGKNDGSHGGIRYFSCKPKKGLFVALKRLSKYTGRLSISTPGPKESKKLTSSMESKPKSESSITARAIEAHSHVQMSSEHQVNDRVIVSGKDMGTGMLRFAGAVKFAPGFWLGVELDRPRGNNDGSKGGVEYFKCKPNHGVFVLPSKVKKLIERDSSFDLPSSEESSSSSPNPPTTTPPTQRRKKVPVVVRSGGATPRMKTYKGAFTSPVPSSLSLANAPEPVLETGMSVFVNKEKGTVQYIGRTEFAPGVWLGVELRKPSGKNDGSVNGKRYFNCRPSYGIFVKPEKATHRGINCSKLLKQDHSS